MQKPYLEIGRMIKRLTFKGGPLDGQRILIHIGEPCLKARHGYNYTKGNTLYRYKFQGEPHLVDDVAVLTSKKTIPVSKSNKGNLK